MTVTVTRDVPAAEIERLDAQRDRPARPAHLPQQTTRERYLAKLPARDREDRDRYAEYGLRESAEARHAREDDWGNVPKPPDRTARGAR